MDLLLIRRRLGILLQRTLETALPGRPRPMAHSGVLEKSRVRLTDGLKRTKITPTSPPAARCHLITSPQFHAQRVGSAGGGLTSHRQLFRTHCVKFSNLIMVLDTIPVLNLLRQSRP